MAQEAGPEPAATRKTLPWRALLAAAAVVLVCAAAFFYMRTRELYEAQSEHYRLGTYVRFSLYGHDRAKLDAAIVSADSAVAAFEALMSVNIPSSDIGRINTARGAWTEVSAETFALLQYSVKIADETGGAFNPAIGDVVKLWKIGTPQARVPADAEISTALSNIDFHKITFKEENGRHYIKAPSGMALDLGAIAKGCAADLLRRELTDTAGVTGAIIDLGGNIDLTGMPPKNERWRIGLQQPDKPRGEYFAVAEIPAVSVVTSGPYERYFEKNGVRYHHIFDPKTGRPANSDFYSVTVIDSSSAKADALCTALFVMGSARADAFLKTKEPKLKAVFMMKDGKSVLMTPDAGPLITLGQGIRNAGTIGGARK